MRRLLAAAALATLVTTVPAGAQSSRTASQPAPAAKATPRYQRGPDGGCFYVASSGKKQYVERALCAKPGAGATQYQRGPDGGCFHVTPAGKKQYVERAKCE